MTFIVLKHNLDHFYTLFWYGRCHSRFSCTKV